ncbi:MAG: hypothetical protein KC616_13800 [Myxococcales bacterium]|nr:hypothetical protein [Myxococcales bacterium]
MRNRWTLVLALLALLGLASTAGCEIGRGEDGTTERPNGPTATGRTSDPAAVLSPTSVDELARMTDPVARADRFLDLLLSLEPAQYPELARQLQHRSDEWAEFEARLFIWRWGQQEPAAAFATALDWSPNMRDSISYAAARAWARQDPSAAQTAVRLELERANPTLATSLMSGLAHGWAESGDYAGALAFIDERFHSILHREALVEQLVQDMLEKRGLAPTFAWAEDLAGRHDDRSFLSIVFRKIGRNGVLIDPAATSAWLDAFPGDPSYMNRARRAAAVSWGQSDPEAALAWTLAQPASNERRSFGLTAILLDWMLRDESAALVWVRKTPADTGLDEAVSKAATKISERSPESALEWVPSVRDEALRETTLVAVLGRWWQANEAAARAWMSEHGVTEDLRRRVMAEAVPRTPSP